MTGILDTDRMGINPDGDAAIVDFFANGKTVACEIPLLLIAGHSEIEITPNNYWLFIKFVRANRQMYETAVRRHLFGSPSVRNPLRLRNSDFR